MKTNLLLGLIIVLVASTTFATAQKTEDLSLDKGVTPHAELDDVYRRFSDSYRKLDVEMVTDLYTQNTAYIDGGDNIRLGNEAVRKVFSKMFGMVKKRGVDLSISFRILRREINGNVGSDVGIYTVAYSKNGKVLGSSKGKFITVAGKDQDNKWRFRVDVSRNLETPKKKK